jgi:Dockerin type I domain
MSKIRWAVFIALIVTSLSIVVSIFRVGSEPQRIAAPRHFLLPRPAGETARISTSTDAATALSAATSNSNWKIRSHGECCEGNLAAAGPNIFVLLPVLVNGARIQKSTDNGDTWVDKYPLAPASVPFGIEGDMQAWGTDVTFWGTELAAMVTAHSTDYGETFTPIQNPVASAGNDQAWSYLGPFGDLRPGGPLPTDRPYVQAGWNRIGSAVVFSFDGGLTYPLQTPLVGDDGSGSDHIVCRQNAHAPTSPGDTRVANQDFRNHKAGRYGAWGTDRKFYWAEPSISGVQGTDNGSIYICSTNNFGATWAGVQQPITPGPGQNFVVAHTAFDNNGTLYVLHGDKLYVSFNQGESFAFVHTIPHYGSALLADSGSDQFFSVNCGNIDIAIAEAVNGVPGGDTNMWYLRGARVDTANPVWDEELVETVGNDRLDFIQIVVNGNNIPTLSYTKPNDEVTTASRSTPMPVFGGSSCGVIALNAVSRKFHNGTPYDVPLPFSATKPGIECRSGGATGDHTIVVTFPVAVTVAGNGSVKAQVTSGSGQIGSGGTADGNAVTVSGSSVTIPVTNVTNAQRLGVALFGVNDGTNTGDVAIGMGVLLGDTTADGTVNSADISQTKSRSGQPVSATNFRSDVALDGSINSADISLVKSKSGTALP